MLFFQYLAQRLDNPEDLIRLAEEPANGVAGVDAYLRSLEGESSFSQMFGDWLVASLLDESGDRRYGYEDIDVSVFQLSEVGIGGTRKSDLEQYSAEYVELAHPQGAAMLRFQGVDETPLLPTSVDPDGCWWSNRGDSISSTLTRQVDLSAVQSASLSFRIWYELEEGWDYGYVEASSDGGTTWDVLPATGTTTYDPAGNSYGHGYTGMTEGWLRAHADLSPYAGQVADIRFHYVTDDSVNGSGFCVDDIAVPEIGFEDSLQDTGWVTEGFVRTSNRVRQDYIVQVVETGARLRVSRMELDERNRGRFLLEAWAERDRVVVVIAPVAPKTRQATSYVLTVDAGPEP